MIKIYSAHEFQTCNSVKLYVQQWCGTTGLYSVYCTHSLAFHRFHIHYGSFLPSAMFTWPGYCRGPRSLSVCPCVCPSVHQPCVQDNSSSIIPRITKFSQIVCYTNILDEFGFQWPWPTFVTLAAIFVSTLVYKISQVLLCLGSPNFYRLCVILISRMSSDFSDLDLLLWPWRPFLSWPLCTT